MNTETFCFTAGREDKGGSSLEKPHPWILLSQDDETMRKRLAKSLRSDGFLVSETSGDQELLSMLAPKRGADGQTIAPDLVVTDVQMPGADGIRVLSHVRRSNPTVPVILLTAFGSAELAAQAIRLGAATVLDKPIDMDALCALVRSLLPEN